MQGGDKRPSGTALHDLPATEPRGEPGSIPPMDWGTTTDKAGEVYGVICPACITGELLALSTEEAA